MNKPAYISWREVANELAHRMRHQAHCEVHPEAKADPENCPFCADRAAFRLWQRKAGVTGERVSRPVPTPRDCELCECQQHRWNGRPTALKTDPPSTCVCDHPTSRHRFRVPDGTTNG